MSRIIYGIILICIHSSFSQQVYRAAVAQLKPLRDEDATAQKVVKQNAEKYVEYITKAKSENVDIVVFPENGLTTLEPLSKQLIHLESYSLIADEGTIPCNNDTVSEALSIISCAASHQQIYVVINILERGSNTNEYYNTNLVFNDGGKIISKYRKINLYKEHNYKAGNTPKTFTMIRGDKKVTFGILIGSDILNKTATDILSSDAVTNVVYSTSLVSTLPFFSGLSLQSGYVLANGVNLLAASYYSASDGIGGSGIYYILNDTTSELKTLTKNDTVLVISDVPIVNKRTVVSCDNPRKVNMVNIGSRRADTSAIRSFAFAKEMFKTESIKNLTHEVCLEEGLCCHVDWEPESNNLYYKLIISNSSALVANDSHHKHESTLLCGLTACGSDSNCVDNSNELSKVKFKNLTLKVTLKDKQFSAMPVTLKTSLTPSANLEYCTKEENGNQNIIISTKEEDSILSFGIYVRLNSASCIKVSLYMFIVVTFLYLF